MRQPRIAAFTKDPSTGEWTGFWMVNGGTPVRNQLVGDCAKEFAIQEQIPRDEWNDPRKWQFRQPSRDRWEVWEVLQPRRAIIEDLGSVRVGWWTHRPDDKMESVSLSTLVFRLGTLLPDLLANEFAERVLRTSEGWRFSQIEGTGPTTRYEIVEVIDPSTKPCPVCGAFERPGWIVLFNSVERCSACAGTGMEKV